MNWVHWWNTTRLHEALGYQTPTEVEASYHIPGSRSEPRIKTEQNPGRFTGCRADARVGSNRAQLMAIPVQFNLSLNIPHQQAKGKQISAQYPK